MTGRLVKNFTLKEMNIISLDQILPEIVEFAQMVQEFRDYINKPIKVNSWRRSLSENEKAGGDPRSIHLDARAADLAMVFTDDQVRVWIAICARHNKIGGINRYKTFTHIDDHEDKFGHKSFVIRDYRKEK